MEYTIFILLLPLLSFLVLGIGGKWMTHRTAGIIGTTLFRRMSFVKGTAAVVIGSILYKACIQIAILLGLPGNMLKFITAALFLVILITGNLSGRKGGADRAGA